MFSEGLDQSAINWINQGSEEVVEARPALNENSEYKSAPKSMLVHDGRSNFMSPKKSPPLKFHTGLLGKHSLSTLGLCESDEESYSNDSDDDVHESVASASYDPDGYDSDSSDQDYSRFNNIDDFGKPVPHENDEAISDGSRQQGSSINRGPSQMNLRVELPEAIRIFGDVGIDREGEVYVTPYTYPQSSFPSAHPLSMQGTPIHQSRYYDAIDSGTPSAPPVSAVGNGEHGLTEEEKYTDINGVSNGVHVSVDGDVCKESEQNGETLEMSDLTEKQNHSFAVVKEETQRQNCIVDTVDPLPCYDTSGYKAWQTLVTYDACIRLCLHSWDNGCSDALEFLRDECILLRTAFGLNKFLLHRHGVVLKKTEESCSRKPSKVIGKIRVEVKKLRIIPRSRQLKSTYSLYMQAGTKYVRHVSSFVKTGIGALTSASLSFIHEEPLSCLLLLKSSIEEGEIDFGSAICLRPGTADYHEFFPETQGDSLFIEVRNMKQITQGQAVIPISYIAENPNDRIRWWPIYHDEHECIGKVQLLIASSITNEEDKHIKSSPVVETLAYDLLLEAAMRAQKFHARNLCLYGPWKWLLSKFADYYGISGSYATLRYLSYIMNVAIPTKDCLEVILDMLMPVIKAKNDKRLNRQEKTILLDCEARIESLLATVFENYKSLNEHSPTGLLDSLTPIPETAPSALLPAVQIYTLLQDILSPDAQTRLQKHLQTAAQKRCRRHMLETDEFMSSNSENTLTDLIGIATSYLKMKSLCINISREILADVKIHNQHILPSSIDLSNITAAVYSTELSKRIKGFLSACPPSGPLPHVNELLAATCDLERDLETWNLRLVEGGLDSKGLFDSYIMVWIQEMQLEMLELCKAEKVPWTGVTTNHSTSPFAENMYLKIKDSLSQYEIVISRWPQYSLALEYAVADVERSVIKALEKQYNDILAPLKDSIPKKLGMHVQKLARRQSVTHYVVPHQLGTFLNTLKRILEALHCKVEEILKSWASCLPVVTGEKTPAVGEQMNAITVLLRTKFKSYMQASVAKLYSNAQANRCTQLKRILEEAKDSDGEAEVRERMLMLNSQLIDSISNLHEVFTNEIFVTLCRGLWDKMGQSVLRFLEGRKENRVWYKGSYYALGILDDTFASEMQRLQGNSLQEKDVEPPRSIEEARSILRRDAPNGTNQSTYFYF